MAFMMPVVKNDWDIYNARRGGDGPERGPRARKVSECRSEGGAPHGPRAPLSPHRSAPAMRSLGYGPPPVRAPPSRASLRAPRAGPAPPADDKLHTRLVEKLKRALGRAGGRGEERSS